MVPSGEEVKEEITEVEEERKDLCYVSSYKLVGLPQLDSAAAVSDPTKTQAEAKS